MLLRTMWAKGQNASINNTSIFLSSVVQVKKSTKSESGKKNSKKRGNRGKKNKNKNQTPCEREYKNFCIHGECVYHKDLNSTSCK